MLPHAGKTRLQEIVGTLLHYGCAIDSTLGYSQLSTLCAAHTITIDAAFSRSDYASFKHALFTTIKTAIV